MQTKTVAAQMRSLARLSLPIILGNFAYALLGVTDNIMAGMAGKSDLGGVSIGGAFFFPSIVFLQGIISALHPLISRHRGSNNYQKIPYTHFNAVLGSLSFSIIIMAILFLTITFFLDIQKDARMDYVAKGYILAVIFSMPFMGLFASLRAFCEAMGATKVTLYFGLLALVYNIPLNYIFIFGKLGMPKLGGIGCGVGTLLAVILSTISLIIYIKYNKYLYSHSFFVNKYKLVLKDLFYFIKLGTPLGISASVECSCFTIIALLLTPLGAVVVAGHTIALSIASFLYTIPLSVGIAVSILVGFAIGEKNLENLKLNIKAAYSILFFTTAIPLIVIGFGRNYLPYLYNNDAQVVALASTLLIISFINQPFENLQTIQAFILRGFKDTKSVFYITFISFYIIALPIGYLLCYNYIRSPFTEAMGFWIGLFLGLFIASLLYRIRVLYHWKAIKLELNLKKQAIDEKV